MVVPGYPARARPPRSSESTGPAMPGGRGAWTSHWSGPSPNGRRMIAEAATLQQTYADRAVTAYTAMQRSMYASDGTGLYSETAPATGNRYSYVWPFSRALVGTLALAGVPSNLL